MDKTVRLWNLS